MAIALSQVDLAALRLLLAVAQTGKISAGALVCHLSVAAASKRISDLELRLGYGLFDRHARGVVATAAGERVIVYARQVIGLTEALENDLSDEMQGIEGNVRLYANSSAIVQFLPSDLSGFLAGNSTIRVELSEHTSCEVVDALLTERSDLGIFEAGFASAGIHSVPYRRDQLALIVPIGHDLARRRLVRFEEVLDHELVGLPAHTAIQRQLAQSATALGRRLAHPHPGAQFRRGVQPGCGGCGDRGGAAACRRHARALAAAALRDARRSLGAKNVAARLAEAAPAVAGHHPADPPPAGRRYFRTMPDFWISAVQRSSSSARAGLRSLAGR